MNNYPPISIISNVAKISEKLVSDQFYEYLSFKDLISHHQSLFLVYINDLPNCLNDGLAKMYADDTNITFHSRNLTDLEDKMNMESINLNNWLTYPIN